MRLAIAMCAVLLLAGCGDGAADTTTPPPTAPTSTRATVDLATLQPTSTTAATVDSSLPPGVTEADRAAVEQAAREWWEAVYAAYDALPSVSTTRLFEISTQSSEDTRAFAQRLKELGASGTRLVRGEIRQISILGSRIDSPKIATVVTCIADDGGFVGSDGNLTNATLAGQVDELNFEAVGKQWLYSGRTALRKLRDGEQCA